MFPVVFCEFYTNLNGTYLDITQKFPLFLQVSFSFPDLWKLSPVQIVSISLPQAHTLAFFKQIYAYLYWFSCCFSLFSAFTRKNICIFFTVLYTFCSTLNICLLVCIDMQSLTKNFPVFSWKPHFIWKAYSFTPIYGGSTRKRPLHVYSQLRAQVAEAFCLL